MPAHGPGQAVVFMHGYSGREDDWSAWFSALPEGVLGASLRAPVPVGDRWAWVRFDGPGMTTSRLRSDYAAAARGVAPGSSGSGPTGWRWSAGRMAARWCS